jgi:hypothetical protein
MKPEAEQSPKARHRASQLGGRDCHLQVSLNCHFERVM